MKNMNMRKIIFPIIIVFTAIAMMSNSSCFDKRNRAIAKKQIEKDSLAAVNAARKQAQEDSIMTMRVADSLASIDREKILQQEGFVPATVLDQTGLDGCTFMLQLESGQKLIPLNLKKEFMKSKMQVWVKYKKEDAMTVCMAGETVRITEIEVR